MAQDISAKGTSQPTVAEIKKWYNENKESVSLYVKAKDSIRTLRDVTKQQTREVKTVDRETLKGYFNNVGGNEKNLRKVTRYLYYRSNMYFRLINWYAGMWNLNCRKVTPKYDLVKGADPKKSLRQFNDTLDMLDKMDLQGTLTEVLINVYIYDVCYSLAFYDDTGMFFYVLDPDECIIDSRYFGGSFGFSLDMSKWVSDKRQKIIGYLGEPLKSMFDEYKRTNQKWVHCPDKYAACFKFRTDSWDMVIPPFIGLFLQLAGLEDLVDIQAAADELSIYKLIYMPMKVLSGTKESDDFEITPDISYEYFTRLLGAIPQNVGAAMVPGDELKTIDFAKTVDSDTNSVEQCTNQILQTAGGGAVINANKITTNAAFKAWLQSETEFAISTLMPQINSFTNRIISYYVTNPCKVEHFGVSVYTQQEVADSLLKACQYSYSYRLAYGTLVGVSEKETLAMMYMENEVLKLQNNMMYPLTSSFTTSGNSDYTPETGQGAPKKDAGELTDSGDASRNK